jgi:hypothetical protein
MLALVGADRLENTRWKVTLEPDGNSPGARPIQDTLSFKGNLFSALELQRKHGFAAAPYEDDTRGVGGALQGFKADLVSKEEGRTAWSGTVAADQITGEMTWSKKDGSEARYSFKGERLPPEK